MNVSNQFGAWIQFVLQVHPVFTIRSTPVFISLYIFLKHTIIMTQLWNQDITRKKDVYTSVKHGGKNNDKDRKPHCPNFTKALYFKPLNKISKIHNGITCHLNSIRSQISMNY